MEIYERLKHLRKNYLKITQEEFADAIGLSKSNISNIEIGRIKLTDRNIQTLCLAYDINEEWLVNGTGEIFRELSQEEEIAAYLGCLLSKDDDSFQKRFIRALSKMDDNGWLAIESLINNITEKK